MKKSILNVGKALNKAEQKSINGGGKICRQRISHEDCQGPGSVWNPYSIDTNFNPPHISDFGECCIYMN